VNKFKKSKKIVGNVFLSAASLSFALLIIYGIIGEDYGFKCCIFNQN